MIKSGVNKSVADYYFGVLKNLNADSKRDLISKLSQSLNDEDPPSSVSLRSLFGAYKSEETAEEIIEAIRSSRLFNRSIETL